MTPWEQLIEQLSDKWVWLLICGTVSSIFFCVVAVTQFVKCLATKNTTAISTFFATILPITNTLLTLFDLCIFIVFLQTEGRFDWGYLLPICFNGLISAYGVMILKWRHYYQAKHAHLTEIEYYTKYLKPKAWITKRRKLKKTK